MKYSYADNVAFYGSFQSVSLIPISEFLVSVPISIGTNGFSKALKYQDQCDQVTAICIYK